MRAIKPKTCAPRDPFFVRGQQPISASQFLREQTTVWREWQRRRYFSVMAERRPRRFKIGQGNDRVDEWMGRCGSEVYVIIDFLKRIDRGEIEIDWSKILAAIPGVSSDYADGDNDEGEIGVSRANADISTLLNVRKPSSLPPGWSLGCHAEISDF